MAFYDIFSELCKNRGVSPSAVTKAIGLTTANATYWKQGSVPKSETLWKLANYFGVSVDYLLGAGSQINPIFPSRRIFSIMNEKKISLEEMSQITEFPIETIRSFALGGKVENGRNCLEQIAKVLNVEPAFLMGWTNHPDDEANYWSIGENVWKDHNYDPDEAYGAQQVLEPDNADYELVWDALTEVGFSIKSAGIGDGTGPDGDIYYIWHKDAEDPEAERVTLPFRDMLRIVEAVQRDAERRKKEYMQKRFDAEWF